MTILDKREGKRIGLLLGYLGAIIWSEDGEESGGGPIRRSHGG